ncbi:hypothetical protein L6452_22241 [Arctium lappa]|uniref:Uncharacterized protein n=1 Tax=Arctium lappa TaxID=4217 RepID=A0ACB9AYE7_ARCLA|nr:hypothetical protein L6452_22241 [Arctium lappa]
MNLHEVYNSMNEVCDRYVKEGCKTFANKLLQGAPFGNKFSGGRDMRVVVVKSVEGVGIQGVWIEKEDEDGDVMHKQRRKMKMVAIMEVVLESLALGRRR